MNRLAWQALGGLVAGLVTFQLAAGAQESPKAPEAGDLTEMSVEELLNMSVTTASKKKETVGDAPATVLVISKSDIRDRGYSSLNDVLRDLPGMETVENYFSEIGTLVPIRGVVGNNKIVFLVDGVRVNPPGGEEMMLRSDFSVRNAEQIEIIFGPGSTLYGQDAISAVINVITTSQAKGTDASVLGSFGTQSRVEGFTSLGLGLGSGDPQTFVGGHFQFVNSDLTRLDEKFADWWSHYAAVAAPLGIGVVPERRDRGANGQLRVVGKNYSVQGWYRESSRSSSEGGYTPILMYADEAIWHDRSLVGSGKLTLEFGERVVLDSTVTVNHYEIDPETRYVFPISPTQIFLDDFKYGRGTGLTVEETLQLELGEDVEIMAGAVGSFLDLIPKATIPGGADPGGDLVAQGGSFVYYSRKGDASSRTEISRVNEQNYQLFGGYVEAHYKLVPSFKLIGGVRVDTDSRYDTTPFSPRAAVIYSNPELGLSAKYIFSKAFVQPAAYFAYNVFDNGVALNTSNPDLEPEKATSNELSLVLQRSGLVLGAAAYFNQQDNLILVGDLALEANILQDEVYLDLAGNTRRVLTQTTNAGQSESKGIDFYTRYNRNRFAGWASYSFVDYEAEVEGVKSGLPQISKHNVRAGLTFKLLDKLSFTPSLVLRSKPENLGSTFSLDDEVKRPYELNAHVLYTPVDNFDVFLTARNLTDHHYALKGLLGPTPQETLQIRAGARYSF